MNAFLNSVAAFAFGTLCLASCTQGADKDIIKPGGVPRPTENEVLIAACNVKSLPAFTNLLLTLLQDTPDRKEAASRCLFDLLANRSAYSSPQLAALEYLHKQGANVGYECSNRVEDDKTPLQAAVIRSHMELINWLIAQGADVNQISTMNKMTALEMAVMCGKEGENILRWLLENGAYAQEQKTGRSLLIAALRQPEYQDLDTTIPLLIKAGADPYLKDTTEKKSAAEILADRSDIIHLRQIDKKGLYRTLIDQFTPPKDSPFIGIWRNDKDGFEAFGLALNAEGVAIIGINMMPLVPVPWRTIGTNRAAIVFDGKIHQEIILEWVGASNALQMLINDKPGGELLKKQHGTPQTLDEFRKKAKVGKK